MKKLRLLSGLLCGMLTTTPALFSANRFRTKKTPKTSFNFKQFGVSDHGWLRIGLELICCCPVIVTDACVYTEMTVGQHLEWFMKKYSPHIICELYLAWGVTHYAFSKGTSDALRTAGLLDENGDVSKDWHKMLVEALSLYADPSTRGGNDDQFIKKYAVIGLYHKYPAIITTLQEDEDAENFDEPTLAEKFKHEELELLHSFYGLTANNGFISIDERLEILSIYKRDCKNRKALELFPKISADTKAQLIRVPLNDNYDTDDSDHDAK